MHFHRRRVRRGSFDILENVLQVRYARYMEMSLRPWRFKDNTSSVRIFTTMLDIYILQFVSKCRRGRHIIAGTLVVIQFVIPVAFGQSHRIDRFAGATARQDTLFESSVPELIPLGLSIQDRDYRVLYPRPPTSYPSFSGAITSGYIPDHSCPDCQIPRSGVHSGRMVVATGIVVGAHYAVFEYEQSQWYDKYSTVPFHFDDHLDYAYNFDKLGHVFGTYAWALGVARTYEWAGVRPKTAALVGAVFGWVAQFQVEVYDGYIPRFGFDRLDIAANTIGAGWFYAQQRIQTLRNWHFRMGYYPEKIRLPDGSYFELPTDQILADDYSNQSYWMAVRLHNYLPKDKKKYWPSFLMLSGGVALDNWIPGSEFNKGHLAYYISVDLDWSKILPQEYIFGRAFADVLNMFRLPFPAIRVYPGVEFVPIYLGN